MKILCLPKYGDLAASTRQRFLQYRPYLEEAEIFLEARPLLDNAYLERMYAGERTLPFRVLWAYLDRYARIGKPDDVHMIWLHYEALPYLPWSLEKRVFASGLPVVFDMDDAIFHRYDHHPRPLVRKIFGGKIDRVINSSQIVFAGNAYLGERARRADACEVQVVPTVLDTDHYDVAKTYRTDRTDGVSIGWIGAPSTWTEYMVPMMPMLRELACQNDARLIVIGAGKVADAHQHVEHLQWSEKGEVAQIQNMDIGIMPLSDTPWARGKCGYKLIQYMACGLPVVASPVGVNRDIVEHGVNGFLAESDDEWRTSIETLLNDADLRRRMGAAGRKKVEQQYSLRVWGPRVVEILRRVVDEDPPA